jgi:hypothetical protein
MLTCLPVLDHFTRLTDMSCDQILAKKRYWLGPASRYVVHHILYYSSFLSGLRQCVHLKML